MSFPAIALAGAAIGYELLTAPGEKFLYGRSAEESRRILVTSIKKTLDVLLEGREIDPAEAIMLRKKLAKLEQKIGAGFSRDEQNALVDLGYSLSAHGFQSLANTVHGYTSFVGKAVTDATAYLLRQFS